MKFILFSFILISLADVLSAQYVYTIKADSVKLTSCDSSELIIENHTQAVPGFLFNTGNGRTVFKRGVTKINGGLYLIGSDTLNLGANSWMQGGNSFGATGVLGTLDNNPLDIYTNNIPRARWTNTGNLLIGTTTDNGYMLDVAGPVRAKSSLTLTSVVPGNSGDFAIYPNASPIGSPPDFTISVGGGARIFFTDYASIFSGGVSAGSLYTDGPASTGNLTVLGNEFIQSNAGNTDNYIYMGAGGSYRKAAIIEKTLGLYSLMDMNFAFNNSADASTVTADDTKVIFKANGNVLIGATSDSGNRLQVTGTSYFSSNVGIGTSSPSAQLHTTGTVRLAGLTGDNTQTRVLVSDANGNLYYRDASTLAGNGIVSGDLANGSAIIPSLAVNGTISAQRMKLSQGGWPDYVFGEDYRLPQLNEIEEYIQQHGHLPGIPSAVEVERKGVDVGDQQAALLKKIEELTLYMIDQEKKLKTQEQAIGELQQQNIALQQQNKELNDLKREMTELRKLIGK